MHRKIKTLLITVICLVLVAAIIIGILWTLSKKKEPVPVSPVSHLVQGYMGDTPTYDGTVSSNNLQAVLLYFCP